MKTSSSNTLDPKPHRGPVRAVVLDWAGTAVDYGCMGPTAVFVQVFAAHHVEVTLDEVRAFMGYKKIDHIRGMTRLSSVAAKWRAVHGREPGEEEVRALYEMTEPLMVECIRDHADLIPGLLEAVSALRSRGVKIGSTTGYTRSMIDVLVPLAAEKGYAPDAVVCSTDVPSGRPYPWMCYRNAIVLEVFPMEAMVKVGDTVADIEEGLNSGMWTIGLTMTGNELGLPLGEVETLPAEDLRGRLEAIDQRFRDAGAHYTARGIWDLPGIVERIDARLAAGERPI
jgi:phosphonoacetaldehyde hydrolase